MTVYTLVRNLVLRVMDVSTDPPEPPAGSQDQAQVYRASPRFLTYRLLGFWIFVVLSWPVPWSLVVVGLVQGKPPAFVIGLVAMPILAVVQFCAYFATHVDYDLRYYIVTDRSLRVREGAFIVKEKTITYANVQNLKVVQGPLMRLFGIWNLQLDTAGGGAADQGKGESGIHRVQMAGIENARQVRDRIRGHLRSRGIGSGLGDPDDRDDDAPYAPVVSAELRDALRDLRQATAALRAVVRERP